VSLSPEIEPEEAARRHAAGEVALVDVREPGEWEAGRIAGAVHVPLGDLPGRFAELAALGRPLVFVCRVGARSDYAAALAASEGATALNLRGGMHAWTAARLPLEPDGGRVA